MYSQNYQSPLVHYSADSSDESTNNSLVGYSDSQSEESMTLLSSGNFSILLSVASNAQLLSPVPNNFSFENTGTDRPIVNYSPMHAFKSITKKEDKIKSLMAIYYIWHAHV